MEKARDKSASFRGRHSRRKSDYSSPKTPPSSSFDEKFGNDTSWIEHLPEVVEEHDVHEILEEIDRFIDTLSAAVDDKSDPLEVPGVVERFSDIVEFRIARYYSPNSRTKFGKTKEDDSFFLGAVRRVSKLAVAFSHFPSRSAAVSALNRTSMVLQRAMLFLEEELHDLLGDSRDSDANSRVLRTNPSSKDAESDSEEFPAYSAEVMGRMNRIATEMISAGYEAECCRVYSIARWNALNEAVKNLEFEKTSIEERHKMPWQLLEPEIMTWIKVVNHCAAVLFPGERKLCDSVFSDKPSTSVTLASNLVRAVVIELLRFATAVVLADRSAEKLFKFLDMHEAIGDLISAITESCSEDSAGELRSEVSAASDQIGAAAAYIFCDLENSIKGDAARSPVPGGAVHPLTRYVMNYLKYACEYKDTLEQIFQKNKSMVRSMSLAKLNSQDERERKTHANQTVNKSSAFAEEVLTVMELLDSNLETKAKLYRDHSLRYIFLMNNGRYILKKIKESGEILGLMGDTWYRMRSTEVRQYHKNYQRETWGRVLQCLHQDGLQVNGKVHKPAVKERFKSFCALFDEIHKTQSSWVVSDEQLRTELRVSLSAVVIPAYRSFMGRFKQCLDSGRQAEKYIKYQPEDIEMLIEQLFDGNTASMARRRP